MGHPFKIGEARHRSQLSGLTFETCYVRHHRNRRRGCRGQRGPVRELRMVAKRPDSKGVRRPQALQDFIPGAELVDRRRRG